jgi:hypothetical protein
MVLIIYTEQILWKNQICSQPQGFLLSQACDFKAMVAVKKVKRHST